MNQRLAGQVRLRLDLNTRHINHGCNALIGVMTKCYYKLLTAITDSGIPQKHPLINLEYFTIQKEKAFLDIRDPDTFYFLTCYRITHGELKNIVFLDLASSPPNTTVSIARFVCDSTQRTGPRPVSSQSHNHAINVLFQTLS